MIFLFNAYLANGLPPAVAAQFQTWMLQMRVMSMIVMVRYLQTIETQRHVALTPGEQYRQHLKAGGYRP